MFIEVCSLSEARDYQEQQLSVAGLPWDSGSASTMLASRQAPQVSGLDVGTGVPHSSAATCVASTSAQPISVRSLILYLAVFVCEIGVHISWVHGN